MMIKLPFNRQSGDGSSDRPSLRFAEYCREELERLRDSGTEFDEARFRAAVELTVQRLESMEGERKA
jgi:hypothetical protein